MGKFKLPKVDPNLWATITLADLTAGAIFAVAGVLILNEVFKRLETLRTEFQDKFS